MQARIRRRTRPAQEFRDILWIQPRLCQRELKVETIAVPTPASLDPRVRERGFDGHADAYPQVWGADPVARLQRAAVWRLLNVHLPPGARLLDAGCGIGLDAAWLVSTGRQVFGIDASEGMIAVARAAVPSARFAVLPVERAARLLEPPFGEAPFDGALMNFGVINCVPLAETAAALAAVLRPGALAVVVSMPRLPPAWLLHRALSGHPRAALGRLRAEVDLPVCGAPVRTRYLGSSALSTAFAPYFRREDQLGLGFLLPPPGSAPRASTLAALERLEAPLRRLPLLRELGDHVAVAFRRVDV